MRPTHFPPMLRAVADLSRQPARTLTGFLWLILLLAAVTSPALAANTEYHIYDLLMNGAEHRQITMKVERSAQKYTVTYNNEFGDSEVAVFSPDLKPLSYTYHYPDHTQTQVDYDYAGKSIQISGDNQGRYPLLTRTLDNSGSLFFYFSTALPKPSEPAVFYLVQSNVKHIDDPLLRFLIAQLIGPVQMYFQYKNTEVVEAGGSSCTALHYVMGIHDARLRPFWPNVYEFWFRESDHRLIRYQGLNAFRKTDVVTLVDVIEK